jgi:porin
MNTKIVFLVWGIVSMSLGHLQAGAEVAPASVVQPTDLWAQTTLTDDWRGDRAQLTTLGLTIAPSWTQEVFGNPTGGLNQGAVADGQLSLILEADTSKFTCWSEGGLFHANFFYIYGPNLDTQDVGDFSTISNITGYNTFRMQECWYQQPFWNQHISLKIGWIAADTEFFTSTTSGLFIDSTFGAFPFLALNDPYNVPIYPLAAPGIRFSLKPTDNFYFQAGVFSGNNGSQTQNKNGFDLRLDTANGLFIMSEIGYLLNQGPNDKGLVGSYKLGSFVQTSPFQTWISQAGNASSATPLVEQGPDYGIYGVIDQQVYQAESRSISLFLRAGYAPSNINVINPYLDGGLNFNGFIPGRDHDVLGFAAARSWISRAYNNYNQTVNSAPSSTAETVVETTYRVQICPWWTVQPDLQYIIQPGGSTTSHNALILGCRSSILF